MDGAIAIGLVGVGVLVALLSWMARDPKPEATSEPPPAPKPRPNGLTQNNPAVAPNDPAIAPNDEEDWYSIGLLTGFLGTSVENGFIAQHMLRRAKQMTKDRQAESAKNRGDDPDGLATPTDGRTDS